MDIDNWKKVAAILHEALPEIDSALSQANVPISARKLKAFDIVQETMLEVSDYKAFLMSSAHGMFLIIIEDWFRARYGNAINADNEGVFVSALLVHGTPFLMSVPSNFKTSADEPNMVWIGFPASVQSEEHVLEWIQDCVVERLSEGERLTLNETATDTANLIRSIRFDLRFLEDDPDDDIAALAASVRSNLQSSARHLCERTDAGLRMSAWDASQATEKALKLLIRRKGQVPKHTHDLAALADHVESLGCSAVDRAELAKIPSGQAATSIRYSGDMTLPRAFAAYEAALSIAKAVLFEAKPETKYNVREARFKIQRPPWFDFDTKAFSEQLRPLPADKD